ncbi:MAG TPA: phosphoribosylformylglycinamidine synthase subunit PurL [Dehalococcoidia bacterium]|nr:phosphoribosylformylglycinamidine synthase subunit PurL [Dehalococcoidia bacterium]
MTFDQRLIEELSLSVEEYHLIVERLGREPNEVELGIFGAMWSEHCGYKNSKPLLRMLPNSGPRILTQMGGENAGAVDIGDGICIVMKIESHNHPSAIEPYEGAATGVGGIVRDIFAMGARPIATLDSLRFGPLSERRNRYLFGGVVGGIGGYGNCLGIPTVAGEVSFADTYSANPLVNAMCVGIARIDHLVSGRAATPGGIVLLVGADTGRDGIGGANVLASRVFDEGSAELRPTVQVGNPFMEKLLMEACLELAEEHLDWIDGIQDLGAAGLTSSTVESAARAGNGIEIDVARVPRRERGMVPYEIMLSESQERMLVFPKKEHEEDVRRLLERWELKVDVIGRVTGDGNLRVLDGEREAATIPAAMLTEPPEYRRQGERPQYLDSVQGYDLAALPGLEGPAAARDALLRLLASPELADKRWVWRQYDHQVLTNTVVGPGSDAAVLRVKGTKRGIALTTDGNGIYCYLDPYAGGVIAVAEAARNVVCAGAQPIAVTDCLNFGNPEKLEVYYQMEETIRGMAVACEKFATPVISGNVSLYNETNGEPVLPTPVVGMLGLLEDVERRCVMGFQSGGDEVFLLGATLDSPVKALAGSEYLRELRGLVAGRPEIDLDLEARVQRVCLEAIRRGVLCSAHDCSQGGLAVALAECCIAGGTGMDGDAAQPAGRLDAALFGEAQSRIVVSCAASDAAELEALARQVSVPLTRLGRVGGERLTLGGMLDVAIEELAAAYREGLPRVLANT